MPVRSLFEPFVRAPQESIFICDFDGTLAPIVLDPDDAMPAPNAVSVLNALSLRLGCVAIVSGRTVSFLAERLKDCPRVLLAGNYGLEKLIDGRIVVDERALPYRPTMEDAARRARELLPGLLVELKAGLSVTIHWRADPDREPSARKVAREIAETSGLVAHPARKAVELRAPLTIDKGTVVAELCQSYRYAIYAGDDEGDLPAFRALTELHAQDRLFAAVRVAVVSAEAPEDLSQLADVALDGPTSLVAALVDLVAELA